MARDYGEALRNAAVGERNSGQSRNGNGRRNAGNEFDRNAVLGRARPFFGAPAKYHRIAALKTSNCLSFARMRPDQLKNPVLYRFLLSFVLAHVDKFGTGASQCEDLRADEPVVKNDMAFAQHANSLDGQQFRIARTCADQVEFACGLRTLQLPV